ncbi:MAG: DUF2177 family protein [Ilumatobacteraceae bacterium]
MTLTQTLVALAVAAVAMGTLDAAWLGVMVPRLYRPDLGDVMRERPDPVGAALFYVLYVVGIVWLVVSTTNDLGGSTGDAVARGAALGTVAYGTYDLTGRAVLRDFSWRLVVVDIAWGTVLTAVAGGAAFAIAL